MPIVFGITAMGEGRVVQSKEPLAVPCTPGLRPVFSSRPDQPSIPSPRVGGFVLDVLRMFKALPCTTAGYRVPFYRRNTRLVKPHNIRGRMRSASQTRIDLRRPLYFILMCCEKWKTPTFRKNYPVHVFDWFRNKRRF